MFTLLSAALLSGGVIVLFLRFREIFWAILRKRRCSQKVKADVQGIVDAMEPGGGEQQEVSFAFMAKGRAHTGKSVFTPAVAHHYAGGKIEVFYNPAYPEEVYVPGSPIFAEHIAPMIVGTVLTAVGMLGIMAANSLL